MEEPQKPKFVSVSDGDRKHIDNLHRKFNERQHEITKILSRYFGVEKGQVVHSPYPKNPNKGHGSFDVFIDTKSGCVLGFYDNSSGY